MLAYPFHEFARRRMAASIPADLVHIHSFAAFGSYANRAARHPGPVSRSLVAWLRDFQGYHHRILFTDHSLFGGSRRQFDSIRSGLLVERLPHIVCVEKRGKANVAAYASEKGIDVRVWWIPNPVDTVRFHPASVPSTEQLVVGYAGRYEKEGTQEIFRLANEAPPGIQFRVALAIDPDQRTEAERKAKEVGAQVAWNVSNEAMPRFYNGLHIFLNPFGFGIPRTVLEAMACGRIVLRLTTGQEDDAELPESISPRVDIREPAEVFREIWRLGERDLLARVGGASRQYAEEFYSAKLVASRYRETYTTVAAGS